MPNTTARYTGLAGAPDCDTFLELTDDAIPVGEWVSKVSYSSCGAVATFSGTTRDNFEGKGVVELFYEAYDEMALKEMKKIADSVREKWEDVKGIVVVHRKGLVPVCEASVVIVVSSPHRVASMAAVRFIIDTLKTTVPIWKKEIYDAGIPSWKQNVEFLNSNVVKGSTQAEAALSQRRWSFGLLCAGLFGAVLLKQQ
eukprot:TRINITY_DN19753_c0_g1_i1.p1 TRINITY_DN19753_c0_g1~~TRINITY_DN19753_c0_g1_i1.p1  ORF type:complete len:205 (+),score=34.64 TRINITY_DN19753_c0_g1_i1:23-616(+)